MDISATTAPRSDQQNFDDYAAAPRTVTVSEVTAGSAEQPVEIHLVEFPGRPYKPSKSMRRVLVAAWGSDSSVYPGRRMTLYGDPTVKFGGTATGGIKIGALSHIDSRLVIALTATRGKRLPHTVEPLPEVQAPAKLPDNSPTPDDIAASTSIPDLRAMYRTASPERQALIAARVDELKAGA